MCQIIFKRQNQEIAERYLVESQTSNPDGWGVMYIEPETRKMKVIGGLGLVTLLDVVDKIPKESRALIHTRWGTQGTTNYDNTHPFPANKSRTVWIMHNGVLSDYSVGGKRFMELDIVARAGKSDTRLLCEDLADQNLKLSVILAKLREYSVGNRFAVMTSTGRIHFVGSFVQDDEYFVSSRNWAGFIYRPEKRKGATFIYDDYYPEDYSGEGWYNRHEAWKANQTAINTNRKCLPAPANGFHYSMRGHNRNEFTRTSGHGRETYKRDPITGRWRWFNDEDELKESISTKLVSIWRRKDAKPK